MSKLEVKVGEFANIAKALPENLRVTCFELLLRHHLEALRPRSGALGADLPSPPKPDVNDPSRDGTVEESAKSQEDIVAPDLHTKAKHYLKKYSLSVDDLNNIFYKEGDEILPLYEDLKTTRMSESQMRIALLQALRNGMQSGVFEAKIEEVRKECTDRKCYDKSNFSANFKNNKSLFDFDKYTKATTNVKLSEVGRKQLAETIKEIQ